MKVYDYEIESEYILQDSGVPNWRPAKLGEYIVGKKDGIRWFIKRNNEYRFPSAAEIPDEAMRDYYLAPAKKYQAERAELRRLMMDVGKLTMEKDHIVPEEVQFIDGERIVLVSRFVEGIARDADFTKVAAGEFMVFCKEVAQLLEKLHACGVVHGDLNVGQKDSVMEGNVVAAIQQGKLTPYLIDFDLSFPAPPAQNPERMPFTENYESPELVPYIDGEEGDHTQITTATDIFSLAIVYHYLWTGEFPTCEEASVGRCVAANRTFTLNNKFNVLLGDKSNASFASLLRWMLAKTPAERPTAKQVVAVLNDEMPVPQIYRTDDATPINISHGHTAKTVAEVDEPWQEHNITFVSAEEIAKKGYLQIKRTDIFERRYKLVTASGVCFTHSWEWLVNEGLATKQ